MPLLSARQLHFYICTSEAHEISSLTSILQLLRLLVHPSCTQDAEHLLNSAGTLTLAQAEILIVIANAATYSKELATCFEDANQEQALHQLRNACQKTLTITKPVTLASKERNFWPALERLLALLKKTLRSVPDADALLIQILSPLKPGNAFEGSVKFANSAYETFRFDFWEMVVSHVETIEEELAKVHI